MSSNFKDFLNLDPITIALVATGLLCVILLYILCTILCKSWNRKQTRQRLTYSKISSVGSSTNFDQKSRRTLMAAEVVEAVQTAVDQKVDPDLVAKNLSATSKRHFKNFLVEILLKKKLRSNNFDQILGPNISLNNSSSGVSA